MKNVLEVESQVTLKGIRLQWYGLAGQCLADLRQIPDGPMVCNSCPECRQYLDNIISTIPDNSIAFQEATELQEAVKETLRVEGAAITGGLENVGAFGRNDIWMNHMILEHAVTKKYFKKLGAICLKHNQFPLQ